MKIHIPAEWLLSKAHLEEGHEIGAGSARMMARREVPTKAAAQTITDISQHVSFGRFITLMRRQKNMTVEMLAKSADVSTEELLVIEHDPHHEPELSTVYGLAKTFDLPPKNIIKMAGLAENGTSRLREESVRFAACSESCEPLSEDEQDALQAILKVIIEDSDRE